MIFRKRNKFESSISKNPAENSLCNPKRGWYSIFPFVLPKKPDFTELSYCLKPTESIVLVRICIKNYNNFVLDDNALTLFSEILDFFKRHKKDIILRITYDDEGNGLLYEPDTISLIETHIKQLCPIIRDYSSYILTTQGIFIGSWGEMHTSRYLGSKELARLFLDFYEASSGSVKMAVRTPNQLRSLELELKKLAPAKYKDILSLMGLYNDAITASETDFGTYSENESRELELQFQNSLCSMVYNGGEAVNPNPLNDGSNAINALKTMHISYLNSQHDLAVLDKWKNETLPKSYGGLTVWDYISTHLGYCMVLSHARLDKHTHDRLAVYVRNDGFASLYDKVRLKITAVNLQGESFNIYSEPVDFIFAENDHCFDCDISSLTAGEYKLSCVLERISDKREITFYNQGLGELHIY